VHPDAGDLEADLESSAMLAAVLDLESSLWLIRRENIHVGKSILKALGRRRIFLHSIMLPLVNVLYSKVDRCVKNRMPIWTVC
jgi:hypothetical protein